MNKLDSSGEIAEYSSFERVIISLIRQKKNSYLSGANQLFNRIYKFSNSESLERLYNSVKNKSCTMSSVKRAVLHYAFGFNGELHPVSFLRVLAFNNRGRKLLAEARKKTDIEIKHSLPAEDIYRDETDFDALSSDMYGTYCKSVFSGGLDYKSTSIYIN